MVITSPALEIFFVELPEIVPFSFGADPVNQGDYVQLGCNVRRGDKPLSLTWSLKGDIISSDPAMTTTMLGQQTSILIISSVDYQHSGQYTCRAENPAGVQTYSAELLVNGKDHPSLEYFICRTPGNCPIHIRGRHHWPGEICSTHLFYPQWWQTTHHNLEFKRRHYLIWPCHHNHYDWSTNESASYILCWLPA